MNQPELVNLKKRVMLGLFLAAQLCVGDCDTYNNQKFIDTLFVTKATDKCVIVTACQFVGIQSEQGGAGINVYSSAKDITLTVTDTMFASCKSSVNGGGIDFTGTACKLARNCAIDNQAIYNAAWAAIMCEFNSHTSTFELTDNSVLNSWSDMNGISVSNGNLTMTNTNMTEVEGTRGNMAVSYLGCDAAVTRFMTVVNNTGYAVLSSVLFCASDKMATILYFDYLNIIDNDQPSGGGAMFTTQIGCEFSNVIAIGNERDLIDAIRFKVSFTDCVWDSHQDEWPEVVDIGNLKTDTVTPTYTMSISRLDGCVFMST